jgi:hypothetical protein
VAVAVRQSGGWRALRGVCGGGGADCGGRGIGRGR